MRQRNAHKFNAVKTEIDGITFHSKAEAYRYAELKLLEKAGEIRNLELQPVFSLSVSKGALTGGQIIGKYVADFRYEKSQDATIPQEWADIVEDVKGMKTALYRWKKRHVEAQYGITITEITSR